MKKSYKNISEFIDMLDAAGELVRIKDEVSPIVEISKYADAESKKPDGGKALLFENVVDNGRKSFPVAVNLFGSDRRMSAALGIERLADAGREIAELTEANPPKSFADFWDLAKKTLPLARILPRKFRGCPPCQEVVKTGKDIDLSEIPVLKCWPHDGGRFITLPLVFTKSPDGKKRNLGMYRLQVYDADTTGMHWHVHKDGSHFFKEYAKAKKRMPVAVAIGADPATIYAATAPMPRGIDELLLAGFFRKKGVPMAKCISVDMEVPADAEFVLEGYVDCDERRLEGPFGDHTGYYSLADMYPVFHLTAITRKEKPIYCATLVGPPPMEDCYMAKATERVFLPLLKTVMPEIKEYFLPWEGVFHNIAVVSIEKEFPAHAQKLASGLWGQAQIRGKLRPEVGRYDFKRSSRRARPLRAKPASRRENRNRPHRKNRRRSPPKREKTFARRRIVSRENRGVPESRTSAVRQALRARFLLRGRGEKGRVSREGHFGEAQTRARPRRTFQGRRHFRPGSRYFRQLENSLENL